MEVSLNPELAARLQQWAAKTGREPDELVAEAMEGYFEELKGTREMLDSRYESIRSGETKLIDGDEALRLLKERNGAQRRSA
jgi:predicted DNA-binding protein